MSKIKYWLNYWSSPEGCTAVDARVLHKANAVLAKEISDMRNILEQIKNTKIVPLIQYRKSWLQLMDKIDKVLKVK